MPAVEDLLDEGGEDDRTQHRKGNLESRGPFGDVDNALIRLGFPGNQHQDDRRHDQRSDLEPHSADETPHLAQSKSQPDVLHPVARAALRREVPRNDQRNGDLGRENDREDCVRTFLVRPRPNCDRTDDDCRSHPCNEHYEEITNPPSCACQVRPGGWCHGWGDVALGGRQRLSLERCDRRLPEVVVVIGHAEFEIDAMRRAVCRASTSRRISR